MSTDLSAATGTEVSKTTLDKVLPIRRREIFWRAKYVRASGYLEHLPFLFWMVGDTTPDRLVTLGMNDGVAHFALCQAVERLGLDAVCHGIDCRGTQAESGMPEAVSAYNAQQYDEFSKLVSIEEDAAHKLFEKESIDMLVIDRDLSVPLLDRLVTRWLPRLSEGGVIILRDLDAVAQDAELRKALADFCDTRSHLKMEHGGGLLFAAKGEAVPPRVAQLLEVARDPGLFRAIQRVFQRLGAGYAHEWSALRDRDELSRLRSSLLVEQEETRSLRAAGQDLQSQLDRLTEAYDKRHERTNRIEVELSDLRKENAQIRQDIATLTQRAELAEAELEKLRGADQRAQAAEAELETLRGADQRATVAEAELETLRGADQRAADAEAELETLRGADQRAADAEAELETLRGTDKRAADAEAELETLRGVREEVERLRRVHFEEMATLTQHFAGRENELVEACAKAERELATWQDKIRIVEKTYDDQVAKLAARDIAFGKLTQQLQDARSQAEERERLLVQKSEEITDLFRLLDGQDFGSGRLAIQEDLLVRATQALQEAEREAETLAHELGACRQTVAQLTAERRGLEDAQGNAGTA